MPDPDSKPLIDDGYCLSCGYSLRGLDSRRCPECGREFDPSDRSTLNFGRKLRAWERQLLRPMSWYSILPAIIATAILICLSGRLGLTLEPISLLKQEFLGRPRHDGSSAISDALYWRPVARDIAFEAVWMLWAVFLLLRWMKGQLRLLIPRRLKRQNSPAAAPPGRRWAVIGSAILSVIFLMFGWQHRVAARWMSDARYLAFMRSQSSTGQYAYPERLSFELTPQEVSQLFESLLTNTSKPGDRIDLLEMLMENAGASSMTTICHASRLESDEQVLVWELRAIGLFRDPSTEALLTARLDDPRPAVRAAAIDALGILRHPSYSIVQQASEGRGFPLKLDTSSLWLLADLSHWPGGSSDPNWGASNDLKDDPLNNIDSALRERFQKMMLVGETNEEREAAARALVNWPPLKYRLRVAEWGVWLENKGHLSLSKSLVDEIPPFVHRTGNASSELSKFFSAPSVVFKPIIHLSSDTPLAVDLSVAIREGRPWFAYPYPDHFSIDDSPSYIQSQQAVTLGYDKRPDLDPPTTQVVQDLREGYPWLSPHHVIFGGSGGMEHLNVVAGIGVHWQSLIVSPTMLNWMSLPEVPPDQTFQWWAHLRQVPSDWVCSRGETERFLYYDGPTRSRVPVTVTLDDNASQLTFKMLQDVVRSAEEPNVLDSPLIASAVPSGPPEREGLYIEVANGVANGERLSLTDEESQTMTVALSLHGDAVAAEFRKMAIDYGLTEPEADGLVATWSPWLFHAPGKRFILRMSPADYDRQCPMRMRPAPTEVVRLGLVLSEFGPDAPPARQGLSQP